jgi:hypothetical protein
MRDFTHSHLGGDLVPVELGQADGDQRNVRPAA